MKKQVRFALWRSPALLVAGAALVVHPERAWPQVSITGHVRQITTDPASQFDPAISGNIIVYTDLRNGNADIYYFDLAANAEIRVTTEPTPSISGNVVVYDGTRAGERDVFVYDLAAGRETRPALAGVQRNANVSGDWMAFEDVSTGPSAITLYHIPSGTLFTAVANAANNYLNAIDGTRVAYTSDVYLAAMGDPKWHVI